jgi:hypothetical protein
MWIWIVGEEKIDRRIGSLMWILVADGSLLKGKETILFTRLWKSVW